MPYTIRKRKCKKSKGGSGNYVLSYTDKNGKKHNNCHSSRRGAQGQIAAIEAEGSNLKNMIQQLVEEILLGESKENKMKMTLTDLRRIIRETIEEMNQSTDELAEDEFSYAAAKAADKGEEKFSVGKGKDKEEFPVTMSKDRAKKILGKQQGK